MVLSPRPDDLYVLLIERTRQPGRRWSGDVALPGGLAEPGDADLAATARRELREEVGLRVGAPLGQLRPLRTVAPRGLARMSLTAFVFTHQGDAVVAAPDEVAAAFWVPMEAIRGRRRWAPRRIGALPAPLPFPERRIAGRRVWGLTLSMLETLSRQIRRDGQ
jgi:8-oxo-dGTP pyrophosphatase MutT (NUDIX family)